MALFQHKFVFKRGRTYVRNALKLDNNVEILHFIAESMLSKSVKIQFSHFVRVPYFSKDILLTLILAFMFQSVTFPYVIRVKYTNYSLSGLRNVAK